MPLKIQRSRHSRIDILDIWDFIAADSRNAAEKLLRRINLHVAMIAENPELGRTRSDIGENVRSFPLGGYTIFYDLHDDSLRVLRILHDARNLKADMFEDRD